MGGKERMMSQTYPGYKTLTVNEDLLGISLVYCVLCMAHISRGLMTRDSIACCCLVTKAEFTVSMEE